MEITISKYQMLFPRMNKKLFDEKNRTYQITALSIRLDELREKGAALVKMGKATKNGTRMTFAVARSKEEYEAELQKIIEQGKELALVFGKKEE